MEERKIRFLSPAEMEAIYKRAHDEKTDGHALVAAEMFQVSPEEVTNRQRLFAKNYTFGYRYGKQINKDQEDG